MASCKLGHIYIVNTVLTNPPKAKFALCICVANNYFVWINSAQRKHSADQMLLEANCHSLIEHDSYLNLSRICHHKDYELANAQEKECISLELCQKIIAFIDDGLEILSPKQAKLIKENLATLLQD